MKDPAPPLPSEASDPAQGAAWLEELRRLLPAPHAERVAALLRWVGWVLQLLELKNLSITRLRQLCFGARTESARNLGDGPREPKTKTGAKRKGHGRRGHAQYTGARRVRVAHATLRPGQQCPSCRRGKLRPQSQPAVSVQFQAQAPVTATVFEQERLRCDTCGRLFTAAPPPEAGTQKYDPSVGVMVALLRYGAGLPAYRLAKLQESLGVPLPCSIQWEQVQRLAQELKPVFEQLVFQAAQSALLYNDDTVMRVLSTRQAIDKETDPQRTGIFTTGIVGQDTEHSTVLLFTGRLHAGENLGRVLDRRQEERPTPMQMCDGLDRNLPQDHATVRCGCNAHARRRFVELRTHCPAECQRVLEAYSHIYRIDAQAKAEGLTPEQRLAWHQTHSQPVMDDLHAWMTDLIENKRVEPNSALGEAIDYARKQWPRLTAFLSVPGAPLDNNAAERILKTAILHRKNSLFYRNENGAGVGDLFMSLIQTCKLNRVNPFDYLLALATHAEAVASAPADWLPWNYHPPPAQSPPASPPSPTPTVAAAVSSAV